MAEDSEHHEEFEHRNVAVVATIIGATVVTLGIIGILLNLGG
jgi:hypothetical protein